MKSTNFAQAYLKIQEKRKQSLLKYLKEKKEKEARRQKYFKNKK